MQKHHSFYAVATRALILKNEFKGGECENEYTRFGQYGTYASASDPFRFMLIVRLAISSSSLILKIEKEWLKKFEIVSSQIDDINSASGTEFRKFSDKEEILEKFLETLKEFNLEDSSIVGVYKTEDEIRECLKDSRSSLIPASPKVSCSGLPLRAYQTEDIQSTLFAFMTEGVKRGYWAIECGLGKTVMAYELFCRLNKRSNIFVVPRTALSEQVLRSFLSYKYPKGRLFVCSGVSLPKDIQDSVKRIKNASELPVDDKQFILVITYDSLPKLRGYHVNCMIFDEAHHLVPSTKKEDREGYIFGLYDNNIQADYRLAITATPKDTTISDDGRVSYIGMSHQPELYGPCLAERNYVFGRNNGFLAPYEVICMKTNPKDIRSQISWLKSLFQLNKDTFSPFLEALEEWENGRSREMAEYIDRDSEEETTISNDTILWYALIGVQLLQLISTYGVRRIISYHTTILRAEKFADIVNTLLQLPQYNTTSLSFSCESVCSSHSNGINQEIKEKYLAKEGTDVRILTNCRTLIEGFDAPSVDCTLFADNKYSPIECCQIVGRGNRKDSTNTLKTHRVCIPFIAYEKADRDSTILRTTNDYKTVRYVVKNIIPSSDTSKTISQTVWVPPIQTATTTRTDVDKTERVWVAPEEQDSHDSLILSKISTEEIAGQTFVAARMWMHNKAKDLSWELTCRTDSDISQRWKRYVETHELPKGIPCDPSKVFKDVGWVNWRDYSGILTRREEWREVNSGEFRRLVEEHGAQMVHKTMSQLHTFVEKAITRRLPDNPRVKWKAGIYDIIGSVNPEWIASIKKLGKFPHGIFIILKKEGIRSINDFERLWPELHLSHTSLPAIPTDIWGDTFWGKYDEYLND